MVIDVEEEALRVRGAVLLRFGITNVCGQERWEGFVVRDVRLEGYLDGS